jgi:NAD(P)-dependent dehydrogenase (short-subunit alcohol dehydrogenase family)
MASERKVAIITGASRGIGASWWRAFGTSATEWSPIRARSAKPLSFAIATSSPSTAILPVPKPPSAIARFGRIDTLVNNAGILIAKPFLDYSEADFAAISAVNLAGFFQMSQKAISAMLRAGSGHVMNIAATIAEQPMVSVAAALATLTKGGLNAVTRALAVEYAGRNIRVNAVSPGVIRTPMHPPAMHEFLAGLAPMNRMGEPRDVVDAVLYLERAPFVTGEILHVDGGASAGRW